MVEKMTEIDIDSDKLKEIALAFLPQIIIQHNLEDEFEKNKESTISKILNIIRDKELFNDDSLIFVSKDKYTDLNEIENYIKLNDELINRYPEMFLFEIFSIFEGFLNHYLYSEITLNYDFSLNKASLILSKLSISDKVDWFMEIVVGKSFLTHSSWGNIKSFLNIRNNLVHNKPMVVSKENEFMDKISSENLVSLIGEIRLFSEEISQTKSIKMKENEDKIESIKSKL